MRHQVWIATLIGLALAVPLAHAQSASGTKAGTYNAGPGGTPQGFTPNALSPGNCGTPDDPKPCGPEPRRALKHFPAKPKAASG
jgi:hypothetical protein